MERVDPEIRQLIYWSVACGLLTMAFVPVAAQDIPAGDDVWHTPAVGETYLTMPGADLDMLCGAAPGTHVDTVVHLVGRRLPGRGDGDTVITRHGTAVFDTFGDAWVDISVSDFSMITQSPVASSCGELDFTVTLDGPQPTTQMHIHRDGACGGTSTFDIHLDVVFTATSVPDGVQIGTLNYHLELLQPTAVIPWSCDAPPSSLDPDASWFPGVDSGSRVVVARIYDPALGISGVHELTPAKRACGDGLCEGGEDCWSCQSDCGPCSPSPSCGDGTCDAGEDSSTCAVDCGPGSYCGDGTCDAGEDASTCPADCGPVSSCGDGMCDEGEDSSTCPADCGPESECGDGYCSPYESCSSCMADCGACASCGNGVCESSETCWRCPNDCGTCATCDDVCVAQDIPAGADSWHTSADGGTSFTIPGIDLDTLCGAPSGTHADTSVVLGGPSTSPDSVDTTITRHQDAIFPSSGEASVDISVSGLSLVSTAPVSTSCGDLNFTVGLDGPQATTQMHLRRTGPCGGSFDAQLSIDVALAATGSGGEEIGTLPYSTTLSVTEVPWDCRPLARVGFDFGNGWVPGSSGGLIAPRVYTHDFYSGYHEPRPPVLCGNDVCDDPYETCETCPEDCVGTEFCETCGDGTCDAGEDCMSCPADCTGSCFTCGDGVCDPGEECVCGDCPPCETCGDGTCDAGEDCMSCPADCTGSCYTCGDGVCDPGEECVCGDCPPCETCGDGTCDAGEDCTSCPADCTGSCSYCGDGMCDPDEYCVCEDDCGTCPP